MHRIIPAICLLLLAMPVAAQDFTSSDLPIVVIDTEGQEIPDEPKIDAYLGIIYNGPGERNFLTDPHNHYSGRMGIEIRGHSSQSFPKKSYGFETRDAQGENLNVPLLGMPVENDWILYAPYSDKALIRNALAFAIGRDLSDRYASRTRFCEVTLNGEYIGVYVLMEKIKRDAGRVDIQKMESYDIAGDELTGGYMVRIDWPNGVSGGSWGSDYYPFPGAEDWQRTIYCYYYPKPDEITDEQKDYISGYITGFEDLMAGENYTDPFTGYYSLLNNESFADLLIMNEITKNVDGYRLSTYMYKDRDSAGGRLTMGPIWDYNLTFGNASYNDCQSTEGFFIYWQNDLDPKQIPFWWDSLLDDPVFRNRLALRWRDLRQDVLSWQSLTTRIDSLTTQLDEAQERNFERWDILSEWVWPNSFVGDTWPAEVEFLTDWLDDRITWMDANLPAVRAEVHWVPADMAGAGSAPDQTLNLPLSHWYSWQADTDEITFVTDDPGLVIEQTVDSLALTATTVGEHRFLALAWEGGEVVDISPMYTFAVSNSNIVVNEIMYNPAATAESGDWIELYNTSTEPVDIGNWLLMDDDETHIFQIPVDTVIPADGYVVLAGDPVAFAAVYGFSDVIGPLGFGFGDDDQVRLFDQAGVLQDMVAYDNMPPWPVTPDGLGYSLELIDPTSNNSLAINWRESLVLYGSPGATNNDQTAVDDSGFNPPDILFSVDNYPNPFNPVTSIRFSLSDAGPVSVTVYDVTGKRVRTLLHSAYYPSGMSKVVWQGRDDQQYDLPSGVYFSRVEAGNESAVGKMILTK